MHVIHVRNVHQALPEGLYQLRSSGVKRETRNGPALVFPTPVTTLYDNPRERVLFWPERDANPFFHFFEALWMLAGRNDVEFPASFANNMRNYSDDGKIFHGAYGHRWRKHFGFDQIASIIVNLRRNPQDRRQVLQIWDSCEDLIIDCKLKDLPCNTQIFFQRNDKGNLDMTVCNRSNDIIWGAYGSNAVHFSMLQEFMATAIGCEVGRYWQISNNFHGYLNTIEPIMHLADLAGDGFRRYLCPYAQGVTVVQLINTDLHTWLSDLTMLLDGGAVGFQDKFFRKLAAPLFNAHRAFKNRADKDRFLRAKDWLYNAVDCDWKLACYEWIERRERSAARAQDSGVEYE